jgi:phage FluMu protein Com
MVEIRCKACDAIVYKDSKPFIKLRKKCPKCPSIEFYTLSEEDLEREHLLALDASGSLISELLKD